MSDETARALELAQSNRNEIIRIDAEGSRALERTVCALNAQIEKLNAQLETLIAWRSRASGALAALALAGPIVTALLVKWMSI